MINWELTSIKKDKKYTKMYLEYINWWVNKSFAKLAFITKDPKDILKNGIILDCDFQIQGVVVAVVPSHTIELQEKNTI